MKKIKMTQGLFAIVDDSDFLYLSSFNWYPTKGYACTTVNNNGSRKNVRMHRIIMNPPAGFEVDHIDGNPLNNQRSNLRICTHSENMKNLPKSNRSKHPYKGIVHNYNKWSARIRLDGKDKWLGNFDTPEDAAKAYDNAAREHFGEFARTNFPAGVK